MKVYYIYFLPSTPFSSPIFSPLRVYLVFKLYLRIEHTQKKHLKAKIKTKQERA